MGFWTFQDVSRGFKRLSKEFLAGFVDFRGLLNGFEVSVRSKGFKRHVKAFQCVSNGIYECFCASGGFERFPKFHRFSREFQGF